MKTVMQQHLEWLKARIIVTEQMEQELLEQERQQIIDTLMQVDCDLKRSSAVKYYNEIFNQNQ
jgi:hypothetical protein